MLNLNGNEEPKDDLQEVGIVIDTYADLLKEISVLRRSVIVIMLLLVWMAWSMDSRIEELKAHITALEVESSPIVGPATASDDCKAPPCINTVLSTDPPMMLKHCETPPCAASYWRLR